MNKATHVGTCQWCGREQKLPGGVLAKHGYTTRWGFFQGVCRGSDHDPFEQSCELVKSSIEWAKVELASKLKFAELLENCTDADRFWYFDYREQRNGAWVLKDIKVDDAGRFYISDRWNHKHYAFEYSCSTALEWAQMMNRSRASKVRQEAKRIEEYISYQQERVNTWEPKEVKKIQD